MKISKTLLYLLMATVMVGVFWLVMAVRFRPGRARSPSTSPSAGPAVTNERQAQKSGVQAASPGSPAEAVPPVSTAEEKMRANAGAPPPDDDDSGAPEAPPSAGHAAQASSGLFINGRELTQRQVQQIKMTYGFVAPPGRYWYDSRSGLFGGMGYEAAGFLQPGHDFGPLSANASNGNTGVFINGREINMAEAVYCQRLFGAVYQGHWWLDGRTGNLGLEGNPMPVANVFLALRQAQSSGQQSSYSWHSNATGASGASAGGCSYVSIPGSGSVMTGNCE